MPLAHSLPGSIISRMEGYRIQGGQRPRGKALAPERERSKAWDRYEAWDR